MSLRNVLFLSYFFPPRGGAGVQRALKFVKYLPGFGWRPLVVANGTAGDDGVAREQDRTLLADLPADSVIRYTTLSALETRRYKSWTGPLGRRLCATDPMGWWVSPAVRAAEQLAKEHGAEAILVTMSPFTAAEAGLGLKRRLKLPLVLDLRDPWAMDETRIYPTRWHARRDWAAMRRAMIGADLVIMNTPQAKKAAEDAFAPVRVVDITNGYDEEDFGQAGVEPAPADVLRIVHSGEFHTALARVWDQVRAGAGWAARLKAPRRPIDLWTRTPSYLLGAIQRLVGGGSIPAGKIELVLVGRLSEEDRRMLAESRLGEIIRTTGYLPHRQSVAHLESADLLFLPNHTPLDGGPALVVPGKTYEYLRAGPPVLAMGPPGDMRDFVVECGAGVALAGDDVAGCCAAIERFYKAKLAGERWAQRDRARIARFDRRSLAARLAQELDRLVAAERVARP